jgi:hypothetical protein
MTDAPTLGELIREVAATMPSEATPHEIALAVIDKAGDELARSYLLELVTATVYTKLAQSRNAALNASRTPTAPSKPSAKQARVRDWWTGFLAERVPVGDKNWKQISDCTVEDLQVLIDYRVRDVVSIQARIADYQKIIDAMRRHNATTAGELTADQVTL